MKRRVPVESPTDGLAEGQAEVSLGERRVRLRKERREAYDGGQSTREQTANQGETAEPLIRIEEAELVSI